MTLLSHERWADITRRLLNPDPIVRRSNLLLSGIDLRASQKETPRHRCLHPDDLTGMNGQLAKPVTLERLEREKRRVLSATGDRS